MKGIVNAAAVAEFEKFENDTNCPIDDFDSNTGQFDINFHVDGGCFLESNKKLGGLVFSAPHDERFKVVFVRREPTAHRYYEQF